MSLGLLALSCFAVATLVPWLGRRSARATRGGTAGEVAGLASWLLSLVGSALCIAVGLLGLHGHPWSSNAGGLVSPLWSGAGPGLGLHIDALAGLFLLLIGGVGLPALLVCGAWWRRSGALSASTPSAAAILLTSCFVVVVAANVWTLLLGWEGLTLSFYWLSMIERTRAGRVDAALAAIGFGKLSGAFLTAGLFLLAANSHSLLLTQLGTGSGAARTVGYVLLLAAFATKVGLVPFHVWLPRSYGAAPGPVRALMAGVAVNVGFYGCWRTLDILGPPPGWLADAVMILGGLSALIGIAHACVQTTLSRVVAYSSVENAGLILAAFGVALVGATTHSPSLTAAGLLAATLQVVAHAIGKTLLFASAGIIETATGTDNLDELRGVGRALPWSSTGLAIGAVTMAGLPPGVVFVSEWFILETLMQQFRLDHHLVFTLPMALTGALVALTAGFAGVAFIRLVAFTALGRTNKRFLHDEVTSRDADWPARFGLVLLCLACVVVAGLAPYEISLMARGLAPIVSPDLVRGAVTRGWVLGPVYPGFSVLSPSWLCLELPLMLLAVLLLSRLVAGRRMWTVREVPPWRSATGGVSGADEYTPFGYANPTRRVLVHVLRPHAEVHELEADELEPAGAQLSYEAEVVELTEAYLYRPFVAVARWAVRLALRLQNGRLDAYLLYMLIVLVAVLAVVSAGA